MTSVSFFEYYHFDTSFLTSSQETRVISLWYHMDRAWMVAILEQNGLPLPATLSTLDRKWIQHGRTILDRSKKLLRCMGLPRDAEYEDNMRILRLCPLVAEAMQAFLEYREASGVDTSIPFSYNDYIGVEEYHHVMTVLMGLATYESSLGEIFKQDAEERACKVSAAECANCSTTESTLMQCSRCGLVKYCGKACQTQHWRASHKALCIRKEDRVPSLFANLPQVEGDACRICLESIHSAAALTTLACGHKFHASCVAGQVACPLCRARM
jgi:hypothetical protein